MAPIYEPKAKRRRLDQHEPDQEFTIRSAQDLHDLLRFRQSSSPEVKNAIQRFKTFLTDIAKPGDDTERTSRLRILKEYCDDQSSGDTQITGFPDLISTWSFAAQSNNDSILSAVPAVLALFFKTISTRIQFRDFGLSLCRALLEREQLRLFDRGLTSAKNKEFLISPCLRLLTEIVSFDGGAVAHSLYSRRDTVFKRLDVLLATVPYGDEDQKRKPTVRRNAQRYVLANLKLQSSSVKADLITEGKILRRTLQGLSRDGSDIIADILSSVKKDILEDTEIPRKAKTRFFNVANLAFIASAYDVADSDQAPENGSLQQITTLDPETGSGIAKPKHKQNVRTIAHDLLVQVCTQQENGVLLPDTGWYPLGNDPEESINQAEEETIDLGLNSPLYFDNYAHRIPVKNGTLSTFIQALRPAEDNLQAGLLLKIFEAAPELIADYFSKNSKFSSEPKAEAAWLGEAAFLFSVIELPIPAHCGWNLKLPTAPPPTSIVVESILPRPLDRSTITRCLNLNHEVITLFAARVVTVALSKLQKTLALLGTGLHKRELWVQASDKLKMALSQRCPPVKVVIQALQRAPKDDVDLRVALIELLAMFFRVLPSGALKEKFDVSSTLTEVMNRLDTDTLNESERGDLYEQVTNLVFVAEMSPLTNWWSKSGNDLSIFSRLLRLAAASSATSDVKPVHAVLKSISIEKGVLANHHAFDALLASVTSVEKWSPSPATFAFIDNCVGRVVRQPVHYLDLNALSVDVDGESSAVGLLPACIAEQWPFVAKTDDLDAQTNIAEWIARFFSVLEPTEEGAEKSNTASTRNEMIKTTHGMSGTILEEAFKKQVKHNVKLSPSDKPKEPQTNGDVDMRDAKSPSPKVLLENVFGVPKSSPKSFQGLGRRDTEDLESAISSGRLDRLLDCIASTEEETRRQAFLTVQQLMVTVKDSSYPEKSPLYLLLGEVYETVRSGGLETTVPSIVAEAASRIVAIIGEPSHKMYGKVNKFLNKAPSWDAQKVISFWIDRVLLKEPEDDDGHDLEVNWLLDLLVDGLRNAEDMELYRKANVFERVLSLYCSPQLSAKIRHKILQLVYRAVQVGGSMTLITRAGILSWIEGQLSSAKDTDILLGLREAIEKGTDAEEVKAWKTRSAKGRLEAVRS